MGRALVLWACCFCCPRADAFPTARRAGIGRPRALAQRHAEARPGGGTVGGRGAGDANANASADADPDDNADAPRTHRIEFVSPLLDYGYPPAARDLEARQAGGTNERHEKPILLYLPGFDGTYVCPFLQFPELGTEFEVWCMTIGMEDRSTYDELKSVVLDVLRTDLAAGHRADEAVPAGASSESRSEGESETEEAVPGERAPAAGGSGRFSGLFGGNGRKAGAKTTGRPVYLAGESFGGILASDVARTLLEEQNAPGGAGGASTVDLKGLVLINPATCYDRSQLATAGPSVASAPSPFYLLGLFSKLVPLFTDEFSVEQLLLILSAKGLPSVIDTPRREAYMGRVAFSLPTKLGYMSASTLSWRLDEWLKTGCASTRRSSFGAFPDFRSLIVVGEKDKTLPSIAEAERLANKVMNPGKTRIHVVDGAGHASTCGSRLDLAAVIRNCFPELQTPKGRRKPSRKSRGEDPEEELLEDANPKRTSMKPEAAGGSGPRFGMEERYDKADVGLNPLFYWSKSHYRAVRQDSQQRKVRVPGEAPSVPYQKAVYTVQE